MFLNNGLFIIAPTIFFTLSAFAASTPDLYETPRPGLTKYFFSIEVTDPKAELKTLKTTIYRGTMCIPGKIDDTEFFAACDLTPQDNITVALKCFTDSEGTSAIELATFNVKNGTGQIDPSGFGAALSRCYSSKTNDDGKEYILTTAFLSDIISGGVKQFSENLIFIDAPKEKQKYAEINGDHNTGFFMGFGADGFPERKAKYIQAYQTAVDQAKKVAVAAKKQQELDYAKNGYPLTEYLFQPCYQLQVTSARAGTSLSNDWIPKSGKKFQANDQLYKVKAQISQKPITLLIEGPTQMVDDLNTQCLALLQVSKESQLKTTTLPMPGYQIKIGDYISQFDVKSIGSKQVDLKSPKHISAIKRTLPLLELVGTVSMAQPE